MDKFDEIKNIIDKYSDEKNINNKPSPEVAELMEQIRKEKDLSKEEEIIKIMNDFSKKHNLNNEAENPLERIYENSITNSEIEIHGETYSSKNTTKLTKKDILKTIIAIIIIGAAFKGAIDYELLNEYKNTDDSKIEFEEDIQIEKTR